MLIKNVAQRSPEWKHWRMSGVSASCAAVILKRSPYKTPWRLWAEKTGRAVEEDLSNNMHVLRGLRLEDRARMQCEKVLGEDFLLPVCAASDKNPLVLASFDGLTEENIPTELKCPCEKNYKDVVLNGEASTPYKLHYPQVQQQIFVADAPYGWLMFYGPGDDGDHRIFKIQRDDSLISELLVGIDDFWTYVQKDTSPPLDPDRDIFLPSESDSEEWVRHATDYRLFDQQINAIQQSIEHMKLKRDLAQKSMQKMMGDFYRAEYAGVSITRFNRQGAIDYEKFLLENGIHAAQEEVEKYRKKGSMQYRVTVTDQAMPRHLNDQEMIERLSGVSDGAIQSFYF